MKTEPKTATTAGKERSRLLAEGLGWYGTVAIIGAYALVSFKLISASGWTFQLLNLTGACGLMVVYVSKRVRPAIALNAFWSLIAIVAMARLLLG